MATKSKLLKFRVTWTESTRFFVDVNAKSRAEVLRKVRQASCGNPSNIDLGAPVIVADHAIDDVLVEEVRRK